MPNIYTGLVTLKESFIEYSEKVLAAIVCWEIGTTVIYGDEGGGRTLA